MLKYLLRVIKSAIAIAVLERYRHLSIHLIKIEVAKSYLSAVQMARVSAIGLMRDGTGHFADLRWCADIARRTICAAALYRKSESAFRCCPRSGLCDHRLCCASRLHE